MKNPIISLIFFVALLLGVAGFSLASIVSGTIDTTYKYAWGDKCGWVNFGCDNCNISITDSSLGGYLWNEVYGWINLRPDKSGVKNNGEGALSGYAWGESSGWIDFSGVTINSAGQFSGVATGDTVGSISFNCAGCGVKTDWRPISIRTGGPTSGGASPVAPSGGFSIVINNGQADTNNPVTTLTLQAGSDTQQVAISNSLNFDGVAKEVFQSAKKWVLPSGDGQKTVYVRFYNQSGLSSDTVSDSINLDTTGPAIKVTKFKTLYSKNENIILGGIAESNNELILSWGDYYGITNADSKGNWLIDLGKMTTGTHVLTITARDFLGNKTVIVVEISVDIPLEPKLPQQPETPQTPETPAAPGQETPSQPSGPSSGQPAEQPKESVFSKIKGQVVSFLGFFTKGDQPLKLIIIPKKTPKVLTGSWSLLPVNPQEKKWNLMPVNPQESL